MVKLGLPLWSKLQKIVSKMFPKHYPKNCLKSPQSLSLKCHRNVRDQQRPIGKSKYQTNLPKIVPKHCFKNCPKNRFENVPKVVPKISERFFQKLSQKLTSKLSQVLNIVTKIVQN